MTEPEELDDPEVALRQARDRFVASFPLRIDAMRLLVERAGTHSGPAANLSQLAHKMIGLAGMVGLAAVSRGAADLEREAEAEQVNDRGVREAFERLIAAFSTDMAAPLPAWAATQPATASGNILLIEDDVEQRQLVAAALRQAGYRIAQVGAGDTGPATARLLQPDLILLDVDLPGLDGYSVCRQIKAEPSTRHIPVVFLTSRADPTERMAGLTLGADDYLTKPFDIAELLLRLRRLTTRAQAEPPVAPTPALRVTANAAVGLDYGRFVSVATDLLQAGPGALALVRAAAGADSVFGPVSDELRRKDVIGRYSESHLLLLLPDLTSAAAADRLDGIIGRLKAQGVEGITAGIAAHGGGAVDVPGLVAAADLALASARVSGRTIAIAGASNAAPPSALTGHVLIAEDDPDVLHIIDPRLQAAGWRTTLAFDGQQALQAISKEAPDVVLLDLMMPKLTGFDVLARLREMPPPRPRVIVMSARGREEDVTRAFDLGADDYITKPFSPQELTARIARLLR